MSPDPHIKNSLAERDERAHSILRAKLIRGVGCSLLVQPKKFGKASQSSRLT